MLASAPFCRVSVGLCLSVSIPYTFSSLSHDKGLKKSVLAFLCGYLRLGSFRICRTHDIIFVSSTNFCLLAKARDNRNIPRRETAIPRRGIAISRRGTDFSSTFLEFMYYMERICSKYSRARFPRQVVVPHISSSGYGNSMNSRQGRSGTPRFYILDMRKTQFVELTTLYYIYVCARERG